MNNEYGYGTASEADIADGNVTDAYFLRTEEALEEAGLPIPQYTKIDSRTERKCTASFTVEESERLWDYMGNPLPGFDYKWPERFITDSSQ